VWQFKCEDVGFSENQSSSNNAVSFGTESPKINRTIRYDRVYISPLHKSAPRSFSRMMQRRQLDASGNSWKDRFAAFAQQVVKEKEKGEIMKLGVDRSYENDTFISMLLSDAISAREEINHMIDFCRRRVIQIRGDRPRK